MKKFYWVAILSIIAMSSYSAPARFRFDGWEIAVRDGMTRKLVETSSGFEIKTELSGDRSGSFGKLSFIVPSDSDAVHLLEVEATMPVRSATHYFDGFEEKKRDGKTPWERNTIMQTFPLAAAWDDANGVALGLSPDSFVSHMRNGIRRTENGDELYFTTRVVADKQRRQELTFCKFEFKPEFGWRNAVDEYYRKYPSYFEPAPGVDQRIYGIGGYFVSTHTTRNMEIHSGRQLGLGWEWTYCPWVLAGNWFVEPGEWKTGDGYMHWSKYWERKPCSYEEYLAAETERFRSGDRQAAMLFYILVKDIAKELVDKFPESRHKEQNGELNRNSYLYSLPDNKNKTYHAFAYGSGLAGYLEDKLEKAADRYRISGFALDMTNFAVNEYNDAQMKFAFGRSFDEQGKIHTADSLLPIPFSNYIHSLKKDGKTMAVYMNHALEAQPALPIFYADGVMFEGNPEMQIENFRSLRLMSGKKPMTFWNAIAVDGKNNAINWTLAQQPEIRKHVTEGLAHYLLFNCLRFGVSPMNWAVAYQDGAFFRPYLDLITDLKKAGWQVVPAIKWNSGADLWCGRFGSGKETIFTISNPANHEISAAVRLVNSYLGDFFPKAVTGQSIKPEKKDGITAFAITLQPKEIMVLRDIDWQPRASPALLSDRDMITGFFTMDDAENGTISVVVPDRENLVVYDYFDRYYPYIRGCRELDGKIFTREPRLINPGYNHCWKLPLKSTLGTGKQIVIGSPEQFPELEPDTDLAEHGFIKVFPEKSIMWIGGRNASAVRQASDCYFTLMDQKLMSWRK